MQTAFIGAANRRGRRHQTERDAFSLGLFHNTTRWLADGPRRATPEAVREAVRWLREARDSGGTELGVALEQALDRKRTAGDFARHVLVITDAEVSDAGRILRLAAGKSRRPDRRRISVPCIDAAPNALLATELAEQGGGVARFLTSQPEELDVATALDEVLADWGEPVLAGLRLEVNRPRVEAAGREVLGPAEGGWSAIDLGDLPAGRPVWVAGRVPRGEGELAFRLRRARGHEVTSCRLDLQAADARPALKALFGARRVRGLEWLLHSGMASDALRERLQSLGYDPATVLAGQPQKEGRVYAENTRADAESALRRLLVREALDCGLPCAETAFVATRTEEGKPVEETVLVANALPSGWSGRFSTVTAMGGGGLSPALSTVWPQTPPPSACPPGIRLRGVPWAPRRRRNDSRPRRRPWSCSAACRRSRAARPSCSIPLPARLRDRCPSGGRSSVWRCVSRTGPLRRRAWTPASAC
jgi:Ca-activated chloride channel family protein